jgi:hypothetical protein
MYVRAKINNKTPDTKRENLVSKIQKPDPPRSINSPVDQILFLQRTIGNQAVQRLFKSGIIQAKLKIGQPNDIYEQEANRIAEQVMRMSEPQLQRHPEEEKDAVLNDSEGTIQTKPIASQITPLVQRQVEEEEEELIQSKENSSSTAEVTSAIESNINLLRGGGQPLSESVKIYFEPRFGHDFSHVRIHTDNKANELAKLINAKAFTTGKDVVFGAGQYSFNTSTGKRLLAHELTHVVQQNKESSKKIQKTNGESYSTVEIEGVTFYTSYFTGGEAIVGEARARMNNPIIRKAYSSQIQWFFTRNSDLAGFTTEEQALQGWKKDTMCKEMPGLGCEYEDTGRNKKFKRWTNYPSGEGSVWWGNVYTCNVFVYDVLYNCGLNPPVAGNNHYFDPSATYSRTGPLASYFDDISADQIQPGDIFATPVHMEILTSTLKESEVTKGRKKVKVKTFSSIGAGKNGVGVSESSGVRVTGKRFRRIKS